MAVLFIKFLCLSLLMSVAVADETRHATQTGKFNVSTVSLTPEDTNNITPRNLNCDKILLSEGDYEMYDNRNVYVKAYEKIYKKTEYEIHREGILVCTFAFTKEKDNLSPIMGFVTLAGLSLSCIGLLLHLIAFCLVPSLRQNLSEYSLASLCIALLLAYTTFIIGIFSEPGTNICRIIAAVMYYFFLSSFFWMNILGFHTWRSLRMAISEGKYFSRQMRIFFYYSIYGWLVPVVLVFIVVLLDTTQPKGFPTYLLPSLGQTMCWFGQRNSLLVFFAAPSMILMSTNLIFFVHICIMTGCKTQSTYQSQLQLPRLYMKLALLIGLSWIIGIIAGLFQISALWYVFVLLNTLQGVFIFFTFTCKKKNFEFIISGSCFRKSKEDFELSRNTSMANL